MAASAPPTDPLSEIETLTRTLASLEAQFSEHKIQQDEYNALSSQLKARISNAESMAYLRAKTDESIASKLRATNYLESKVQQICYHFLNNQKSLEPTFEADRVPRYYIEPEKGARLGVDSSLLRRLADIGILKASLFEKIFMCPTCGTPTNVYARFKCPQCGSSDISMNRMVEHLACGTIHDEKVFRVGNVSICPTCKKVLQKPSEERFIGLMCSCSKCRAHFEDPAQSFFCRGCQVDFNLITGIVMDFYTYSINEQTIEETRAQIGIPAIAQILQRNGYEVAAPGTVTGGVGQYSLVARKGSRTIAIDLDSSESEVAVEPVLALFVKLLESKPDMAIFAALPRLSSRAQEVASMHGIKVAEGSTPTLVANKILEIAAAA